MNFYPRLRQGRGPRNTRAILRRQREAALWKLRQSFVAGRVDVTAVTNETVEPPYSEELIMPLPSRVSSPLDGRPSAQPLTLMAEGQDRSYEPSTWLRAGRANRDAECEGLRADGKRGASSGAAIVVQEDKVRHEGTAMPRDQQTASRTASTRLRSQYYAAAILQLVAEGRLICRSRSPSRRKDRQFHWNEANIVIVVTFEWDTRLRSSA